MFDTFILMLKTYHSLRPSKIDRFQQIFQHCQKKLVNECIINPSVVIL